MWIRYTNGIEYMENIRKVRREIRLLMEQIERDSVLASGVSAIRYDVDHVQTSPISDRMAEIVTSIVIATDTLHERVIELQSMETEIRSILVQLKEEHERVLTLHYLDGKSWSQVAEYMGYGEKYTFRLKNRALTELTDVLQSFSECSA